MTSAPLLSFFLICSALEDPEEGWKGKREVKKANQEKWRNKPYPLPYWRFLAPMLDLSYIKWRNFKMSVRFKFEFRLELLIAPDGTVQISESDQGLRSADKITKEKKGESDRTYLKTVVGEKNKQTMKLNLTKLSLLNTLVTCVWKRVIFQFATEEVFHFTCALTFRLSRQSSCFGRMHSLVENWKGSKWL